jgi:hypothetical protein
VLSRLSRNYSPSFSAPLDPDVTATEYGKTPSGP